MASIWPFVTFEKLAFFEITNGQIWHFYFWDLATLGRRGWWLKKKKRRWLYHAKIKLHARPSQRFQIIMKYSGKKLENNCIFYIRLDWKNQELNCFSFCINILQNILFNANSMNLDNYVKIFSPKKTNSLQFLTYSLVWSNLNLPSFFKLSNSR